MPVNTSSTGATYGKSSDPLCPLGFHPQVRWPTRCKRCFRDYKEHNDSNDQKKFGNLGSQSSEQDDPWSARKSTFQKSKSVDVSIGDGTSAGSRFASYTTAASLKTGSQSKAEEDIPEWKRAMLERRQKEKEKEEEEAAKSRNFGFIPGTTLHSSYANKSYEQDSRLSSWGSGSNLRGASSYSSLTGTAADDKVSSTTSSYRKSERATAAASTTAASSISSSSSWSRTTTTKTVEKPESDLSPYEKYLKRKKEQELKDEEEKRRAEEEEKKKARDEERRREEDAERERARKRERERDQKRLEEEKHAEEERKKKAAIEATATPTKKWGVPAKTESPSPALSRFGTSQSATSAVPVDEAVIKRKPWEKPSAGAKTTLPSLNEGNSKSIPASTSARTSIRKTSESDSDKDTSYSIQKISSSSAVHSDSDHDIGTGSKSELEALRNELKAVKTEMMSLKRFMQRRARIIH